MFLVILFVWTSLNRDLDLLKRQDLWEWMEKPCDGIPWCPYPMIVTQHSRKLVAATTSRTNQSRPRTLGTGKPTHGDKHKTRARRINFPSSVTQGHYPRTRTVRREMIVNLLNTCLLPTHFWRHSNIVETIFWWNYFHLSMLLRGERNGTRFTRLISLQVVNRTASMLFEVFKCMKEVHKYSIFANWKSNHSGDLWTF